MFWGQSPWYLDDVWGDYLSICLIFKCDYHGICVILKWGFRGVWMMFGAISMAFEIYYGHLLRDGMEMVAVNAVVPRMALVAFTLMLEITLVRVTVELRTSLVTVDTRERPSSTICFNDFRLYFLFLLSSVRHF